MRTRGELLKIRKLIKPVEALFLFRHEDKRLSLYRYISQQMRKLLNGFHWNKIYIEKSVLRKTLTVAQSKHAGVHSRQSSRPQEYGTGLTGKALGFWYYR